jgi:hypothetical protein
MSGEVPPEEFHRGTRVACTALHRILAVPRRPSKLRPCSSQDEEYVPEGCFGEL